jgi:hypothetical protein
MTRTNELLQKGIPFTVIQDFISVDYKLKNGIKVNESWMKRYNDIKEKYEL